MISSSIIPLDSNNPVQVKAVSEMHNSLLSKSPVSQLGFRFMTKFYYSKLVKDKLIACDLYFHEEKYVGFIAYTKYPFTFMQEGKRRHLFYLIFLLTVSLVCNPYRLLIILRVIKQNRLRQIQQEADNIGEVLSFGVLEEYRKVEDAATGLRISHLLFKNVIEYLRNEDFRKMQVSVEKDNKRALSFYLSYTTSIEDDNLGGSNQSLLTVKL